MKLGDERSWNGLVSELGGGLKAGGELVKPSNNS
jgi:hypothetical protein